MSKERDFGTVVAQARKLGAMFGDLLAVADKLGDIGSLEHTEAETQARVTQLQETAATLSGGNAVKLQELADRIEAGLKAQYAEQEKALANRHSLANESMALSADIVEKRKLLADLERRTDIAEARHRDVMGKLGVLRGSIPSAA